MRSRFLFGILWDSDLRRQCITELAELGNSDHAVLAIAGHMSRRMLEHYSHVRMAAKRTAIESLPRITETGVELRVELQTSKGSKGSKGSRKRLKRKNGRDRDRTDDLYRVNVGGVVYLINLSPFSLHDPGSFSMMLGAYCSQVVPKCSVRD